MDGNFIFNYSRLRGKLKESGLTQSEFARKIGIDPATLSLKLSNRAYFRQTEMEKACIVLGIDKADMGAYFFTYEV